MILDIYKMGFITGVFPVILLPPVFAKMCWEVVCFVSFRKGKLFILHYFSMRILG